MMNRQQKQVSIESFKQSLSSNQGSFVIGIKGMTVDEVQQLRRGVAQKGGSVKVVKNTLMKLAVKDLANAQELAPYFKDQIAIVFAEQDVPGIAKVLFETSNANEKLKLVAGCFESRLISKEQIKDIAKLPAKEVLYARLCGVLNAPVTRFAGLMNQLIARLLIDLKQIEEMKK